MTDAQLEQLQRHGFARGDGNALVFVFGVAPHGPWNDEPDVDRFVHGSRGPGHAALPCAVHRNRMGVLCGYVGVAEGHPWFGVGHDAIAAEVHGGLTFARKAGGVVLCDGAELGDRALWWLGFNCCHAWDVMPFELAMRQSAMFGAGGVRIGLVSVRDEFDEVFAGMGGRYSYKTYAFARAQTCELADQAAAAARRPTS
jgi:hypothetical protein